MKVCTVELGSTTSAVLVFVVRWEKIHGKGKQQRCTHEGKKKNQEMRFVEPSFYGLHLLVCIGRLAQTEGVGGDGTLTESNH